MMLLSESRGNTKLRKSERVEYRIRGLSLAPGSAAVCPHATESCRISCVGGRNSGLAVAFPSIHQARDRKTEWFLRDRKGFLSQLRKEIIHEQQSAENDGAQLVLRMNTYSDLDWAALAADFPDVIFYDYSKVHSRWARIQRGDWPKNYHVTFSWSENPRHQEWCARILIDGGNVAIPFANPGRGYCGHGAYRQQLPGFWDIGGVRFPCLDGDNSDLRFLDENSGSWLAPKPGKGFIVALRLKSANEPARRQAMESGFAVTYNP